MDYNSQRSKLILAEYGRNVQNMVEYALTIEDREKRNRVAKTIVQVMSQLNPGSIENPDYWQKLWDQLIIISDFRLDIDSPYPKPSTEVLNLKSEKLRYRDRNFKYGHYGKNIEKIIRKASEIDDSAEKAIFVEAIANHLKKTYLTWNRDSVNDEVIYGHLDELSGGKLKLSDETQLQHTSDILARNATNNPNNIKKKKFTRQNNNNMRRKKK